MFDLSWPELLFIMCVAILVIGPKELPVIMRMIGRLIRRLQYVRYAFSQQFEEFMEEQDLDDIRNAVNFEQDRYKQNESFDEREADEGEDVMRPLAKAEKISTPSKVQKQDNKRASKSTNKSASQKKDEIIVEKSKSKSKAKTKPKPKLKEDN